MSEINSSNKVKNSESDWAKAADNANQKAQEEFEKIKREAQEELTNGKESFHNPDDSEK